MLSRTTAVFAAGALALAGLSQAQPCTPGIETTLGNPGAPDSGIGSLYPTDYFSPGTKKMLIGGGFSSMGGVGGTSGIALWDGTSFSPLGLGINFPGTAEVNAFAVFGGKLYIGGQFGGAIGGPDSPGIIRWNGSAYEVANTNAAMASVIALRALTIFQNELYIGGTFAGVGSLSTNMIAKLNSTQTDYLPLAFSTSSTGAGVFDMVVFNDGSGDKLYVCGNFGSVRNDDGAGSAVVVPGTKWVARWTGTQWESVGGGIPSAASPANNPREFLVFDDGGGPALYVCTGRATASGAGAESAVHKWNGTAWTALPGFQDGPLDTAFTANSMGLYNDGKGTSILAQVRLSEAAGANPRQLLMKLEDGRFKQIPNTLTDSLVSEIQMFDDGSGLKTWLGGFYTTINGQAANRLARITPCAATCPADFNKTGHLEVQDIFDFLNAWFAGCP